MVSHPLEEPSNWRLIERSSFTSVTKTRVTKTSDPIDVDANTPNQPVSEKFSEKYTSCERQNTDNRSPYSNSIRLEPDVLSTTSADSDIIEHPIRRSDCINTTGKEFASFKEGSITVLPIVSEITAKFWQH